MPHKFAKCVDAALSPRRHIRVHILNYLDDWLILAQSEHELIVHWYVSRRVETLHPGDLERAEVDLFTSEDNSHCPIFFSKDSLKGTGPSMPFPQSLCSFTSSDKSGNTDAQFLWWLPQSWFPEMIQLPTAAP